MKTRLIAPLSPFGIAGLLAGCGPTAHQQAASSVSVAGQPATQPATAPATPDPREAEYLTDVTQLTTGFKAAGEGYFSKDMKWIIFQATPEGETQYQMYVAKLEMEDRSSPKIGAPIRISPPNSRNTCGYFSPDGKTVLFASTAGKEKPDEPNAGYQRQGNNYRWAFPEGMEIYRASMSSIPSADPADALLVPSIPAEAQPATKPTSANHANEGVKVGYANTPREPPTTRPSGGITRPAIAYADPKIEWQESPFKGEPRQLKGGLGFDLATPENRLTNNNAYDAEGSFSPDGKWIVFTSLRTGDGEIWVMKADGTSPVQITHNPGYDGGPFFAPDGKRLIYRSDRKKNDLLQVFVADLAFDADGNITGIKSEKQLTNDANVNWGPFMHPDDKHIIYATSKHGHHNYELYLMRDDGSHQTRITYCPGFDGLPAFSPDGKYLMWSSKRTKDNTTQIFIAKFHMPKDG